MNSNSDEKLWDYYQRVNHSYFDTTSRDKIMMLSKAIKKHTSSSDCICEVGLGSGLMLLELAKHRKVSGLDLCDGTIAQLKSRPEFTNILLRQGNICQLSSIFENIDAVVTIDVIEHLTPEQLEIACREVYRALKEGGKWFINVPWNENLKLNEIFCPHCHSTFHRVGHKQAFDEARLEETIKKAGFQIAFTKRIYPANFLLPLPLMWFYRIIAMIYLKNYAAMFAMAIKK